MPEVNIRRPGGGGILRRMQIKVDGQPAARVGWRREVDLHLEAGRHTVEASADWLSDSVEVDLHEGDRLRMITDVRLRRPFFPRRPAREAMRVRLEVVS